jgi:hypothetical protein
VNFRANQYQKTLEVFITAITPLAVTLIIFTQALNLIICATVKLEGRDYDKHGEGNPNAKLNYQKAQHIRELYASGLHTHLSLSKEFSVSANTINSVLTGKTWV